MAKKQEKVQCRNRQPLEGERIADLAQEPRAKQALDALRDLAEAMRELASGDCPENLRDTKYYQSLLANHSHPGYIEAVVRRQQRMIAEVQKTGYEMVGWPVAYDGGQDIRILNGRHRLALAMALGKPVRAIVQGQKG